MKPKDLEEMIEGLDYVRAFLTGMDPVNDWPHRPRLERVISRCQHNLDMAGRGLEHAANIARDAEAMTIAKQRTASAKGKSTRPAVTVRLGHRKKGPQS